MEADESAEADDEEKDVEEVAEREAELKEIQTKKLMTLVKSKYFMLKANFPQ